MEAKDKPPLLKDEEMADYLRRVEAKGFPFPPNTGKLNREAQYNSIMEHLGLPFRVGEADMDKCPHLIRK